MTLALYGKSRRRRVALIALAALTVLAATLGGMRLISSGSAQVPTRTIRIGKVTDTAGHPGGDFSGSISPGGAATAFSIHLDEDALVGVPNTYEISTGEQLIDETTLPPGWSEFGYGLWPDPEALPLAGKSRRSRC